MSLSGIIIGITGWILYAAAGLFDAALNFFVLQMGGWITGTAGSTGIGIGVSINVIWTTVRDLVNLTFIFGLVYVGFKTILDAGTDTKKLLSSIIIGALLVNFSLFISKVVIDVSNVTASEIYKALNIDNGPVVNGKQLSLSETFMARMGILKLVSPDQNSQDDIVKRFAGAGIGVGDGYIAFVVGASIFILVAAFVFAAGALLLAIRFGVLVILMMLSPIAFAATVFPAFRAYRDKWWNTLFSQAFFAPAYLFMIYATLKVAEGYATETRGFDKIFTSSKGLVSANFATAVFFCLTIVLMVASLILAKQMGAYGAASVVGFGKKVSLRVGKNLRGFAGRYTIGSAARVGERTNDALEKSRWGRRFKTAVSIASLGTFTERTRRKVFEAGTKAKFGGQYSWAEDREFGRKHKKEMGTYDDIQDGTDASARNRAGDTAPDTEDQKLLTALGKAISSRTVAQLEEMGIKSLLDPNVAIHLTAEQMKGIASSSAFEIADINALKAARTGALTEAAKGMKGFGIVYGPDALARRGENELSKMPIDVFIANAGTVAAPEYPMAQRITPAIIEHILKEGGESSEDIETLKKAVQKELDAGTGPGHEAYVRKFRTWVAQNNPYGPGFGLNVPPTASASPPTDSGSFG